MTLLGLAIGALTLLVICGIAFFLARTKRNNFRKTQELIRRLQEPCTNGTFRPLLDNNKSNPPKDGILTRKPVLLPCARNASTQTDRRPLSSVFSLQRPHNGHVLSSSSNLPRQNTVPASFSPQEVGRCRLNAVSSSPECKRAVNNVTVNAVMEADLSTLAACNQSIPDPERGVQPPLVTGKQAGLLGLGASKRSESLDLAPGRRNGLLDSASGKRSISLDLAPAKHTGDGDAVECINTATSDLDMTDGVPDAIGQDMSADDVAMATGGSEATGEEEEDELIAANSSSDSSIGEEQLLFEKLRANPRVSLGEQGNIKEQADPWDEQEPAAEQQGNEQQPGDPRQWDGEPPIWGGQPGISLSLFGNDLFADITNLTIGEESEKPLLDGDSTDDNNRTLLPPYPEMYDPDPDATPV